MTEEDLASTTFSMTFVARGYTGKPAATSSSMLNPDLARSAFTLTCARAADPAAATSTLPDREIVTRISGPEPAYKATATIIVQSAMFLLTEASRLEPGVHTPAALLGSDGIVDRLCKHQIEFELMSDRQLEHR